MLFMKNLLLPVFLAVLGPTAVYADVIPASKEACEVAIPSVLNDATWFENNKLTINQMLMLCSDLNGIQLLLDKTIDYAKQHETTHELTTLDAIRHADKTLHGAPYDQNRLGKVHGSYVPGFKDFYIAGSEIKLAKQTFDLMQAPITAHNDKKDTVQDFWDTVVVMRKSPIIVTTHDPKEKIPIKGYAQRAEYWTHDRFTPYMKLRSGWKLYRQGDDELLLTSRYANGIQLVKREFVAKHKESKQEHLITQFHYQGWPDRLGAADHELLVTALKAVDEECKKKNLHPNTPITVHCAAGMGRSPTFCASNYLRRELLEALEKNTSKEEIRIDFAGTIYQFMKARPGVLQTIEHWQCILFALRRTYLEHMGVANEEIRLLENEVEATTHARAAA